MNLSTVPLGRAIINSAEHARATGQTIVSGRPARISGTAIANRNITATPSQAQNFSNIASLSKCAYRDKLTGPTGSAEGPPVGVRVERQLGCSMLAVEEVQAKR